MNKRMTAARATVGNDACNLSEALSKIFSCQRAKFDESIDIVIKLRVSGKDGVPIRGAVKLPNGAGKEPRVAVFATSSEEVIGAKHISSVPSDLSEFRKEIASYDRCGATPAGMSIASKVAAVIGPMGMMPSAKNNTVMGDTKALVSYLSDSVFFAERDGAIMARVGAVSMGADAVMANIKAIHEAVSGLIDGKTRTIARCYLSSTMSPSVRVSL